MRKLTMTLALGLLTLGASAQEFNKDDASLVLNATGLKNLTQPTRVLLKNISGTNTWWFAGTKNVQNITDEAVFEVVPTQNGVFKLKKAFPTDATNSYLSSNNATPSTPAVNNNITLNTEANAATFKAYTPTTNGAGKEQLSQSGENWQNGKIPMTEIVRFVTQPGEACWINIHNTGGTPRYNSGKGGYTVNIVYNLTGYYKLTLNLVKDGQTTTQTTFYKENSKITVPTYPNYTSDYKETTKDKTDNQTITVNYSTNWTSTLNSLKEEVTTLQQYKGKVGYPNDTEYATLDQAVNNATTADQQTCNTLQQAIDAFKSTTNVNLPVEGKAYTIKAVYPNQTERTLFWNGTKIENGTTTTANSDVFVCRKVADKFVLVNNQGKYLNWFDTGDNTNKGVNNTGATDAYDAKHNTWTVSRATTTKAGGTIISSTTNATLFGLLEMKAEENTSGSHQYLTARVDGQFVSSNPGDKYFDEHANGRTSFFKFTETAYANTPNLLEIVGNAINITGATHIATFSAPFATVIPEGVTAYYVAANGVTASTAKVTAITGNAIPANEGVLLTGKTAGKVTMLPATTETPATLTNNQLGHSAGVNKDLAQETTNFYILTKVGGNVGFFLGDKTKNTVLKMNKSYLKAQSAAAAIRLEFDTTTGITDAQMTPATQAPIYDLSGRRVTQLNKKGIYIQGGKKFIVE